MDFWSHVCYTGETADKSQNRGGDKRSIQHAIDTLDEGVKKGGREKN